MLSEVVKLFRILGRRKIWEIVKFPFYDRLSRVWKVPSLEDSEHGTDKKRNENSTCSHSYKYIGSFGFFKSLSPFSNIKYYPYLEWT